MSNETISPVDVDEGSGFKIISLRVLTIHFWSVAGESFLKDVRFSKDAGFVVVQERKSRMGLRGNAPCVSPVYSETHTDLYSGEVRKPRQRARMGG